jgi:hypothetical protein
MAFGPILTSTLDDTATASHELLPLAILAALVEAHHRMSVMLGISLQMAPGAQSTSGYPIVAIILAAPLLSWRW